MLEIPLNSLQAHDPRCTVFNTCGKRLYHYTSIETLALILKNKSIRFNRLDRVNDPREALSLEYTAAQSLVFASCWTDNETETIPLWKLYAGYVGIRLGLPTLMFNGRHNNHKVTTDDRLYELRVESVITGPLLFQIERRGKHIQGLAGNGVYGPTRIRYIEDEALLPTKNVNFGNTTAKYDLRILGTQKLMHWKFEQEVRFRILAMSGYYAEDKSFDWMSPDSFSDTPVITEFVDIPLDASAIEEMEVLLGPKITVAERVIVECLCKQYAPSAKIHSSAIQIR